MRKLSIVFTLLLVLSACASLHAEDLKGKFGLGLNYPGLGFRYAMSRNLYLEAKGQTGDDILVAGIRSYRYLKPVSRVSPFFGLEADYVSFEGEDSKGKGFALELFAGGEYFFVKKLSLQLDVGPAWIVLYDKDYDVSESGIEFVLNLGINWYFGK